MPIKMEIVCNALSLIIIIIIIIYVMKYTSRTIFMFPLEAHASYTRFKTSSFDVYLDSISTTTSFFLIHIYTPFFVKQQKRP